jgi:hypothetical protein
MTRLAELTHMKLLLEGSVPMLVGAFWMGGLAALGSYWVTHQPRSRLAPA